MVGGLAAKVSRLRGDNAGRATMEFCLLIALVGTAMVGAIAVLDRNVDAMFLDLASMLAALT